MIIVILNVGQGAPTLLCVRDQLQNPFCIQDFIQRKEQLQILLALRVLDDIIPTASAATPDPLKVTSHAS
jgi:hypothetical protein